MDRDLRPTIAGCLTTRLAPDALPTLRVEHQLGGGDAHAKQIVKKTELGQLANGMGQDVDANTQLLDSRGRLVDVDVSDPPTSLRQPALKQLRHLIPKVTGCNRDWDYSRDYHRACEKQSRLHSCQRANRDR